jgi:Ni/Co efflux regulator RcnB
MKKLILSAVAAMVAAAPIAATTADAQTRTTTTTVRHTGHGTVVTKKTSYRNFRAGQRFDRRYARNYREVSDYRRYRLAAPGRGYRWVRAGNDAVLIRSNGYVTRVITGRFG